MQEPQAFCRAVMHEYERRWSRASGHGVRHPLRLKMERLQTWCGQSCSAAEFEQRLSEAQGSDDLGEALLAEELLPMWRSVRGGGQLRLASD
ncbi:MAG: hypothetical protein M3336_07675 [Chloroflexota bacterium]|nr:hypothetical protein [Chloroflexota bacterium]